MPRLINAKTGSLDWVSDDEAGAKLSSGEYTYPEEVGVKTSGGAPVTIPGKDVPLASGLGYSQATPKELHEADVERAYGDQPITALLEGAAGTLLPGSTTILKEIYGGSQGMVERAKSTAGQVGKYGAMLLPVGAPGAVGKLGGAVTGVAGRVAGGVAEGAGYGLIDVLAEEGLSNDPINIEHIMAAVGSSAMVGGVAGGTAALISKGATAAKNFTANMLTRGKPAVTAVELEAAASKEIADLTAAAPKGEVLASEVSALRNDFRKMMGNKKDGYGIVSRLPHSDPDIFQIAKKAQRAFGNVTDRADDLITNPAIAKNALQLQKKFLTQAIDDAGNMRLRLANQGYGPSPVKPKGGTRWQYLESGELEGMLDRNIQLTNRINELSAVPKAIADIEKRTASAVREANKAETIEGMKGNSLAKRLVQSLVFGGVTNTLSSVMGGKAAIVGGWAASHITRDVLGKLGTKLGDGANRAAMAANSAIKTFFKASEAGSKRLAPLAVKALQEPVGRLEEAEGGIPLQRYPKPTTDKTRALYEKRIEEVKSQTMMDMNLMMPVMKPSAREAIGKNLSGVALIDPKLADGMETVAARKTEFLAAKAPKNPGMPGWEASHGDIDKWARYLDASNRPIGVLDRMANGSMTPEDVETVKTVFPELYREWTNQILIEVGKIGGPKKLPYWKRLMVSMFTGVPQDPSLYSNVVAVFQSNYQNEPGTEGGTQAPPVDPNFGKMGSTKKGEDTEATKAQELSS